MKKISSLIVFLVVFTGHAQWTTDTDMNTLVVDSEGGDMKAIGGSDGETIVVFWKVVAPPTNYELRMQVLDIDGYQMLGNDGMLVSDAIPMSTYTSIWSLTTDLNGHIYVGVTGTGGGEPAYAFKLDSSGNHLWGANGINIGSGFTVTILPQSSGDAIVSWYPGGETVMQKYDSSGNAIWGAPKPVSNNGPDTVPASLFDLSNNEFIMVFHSLTGGIYSNLYAQRFNVDGDPQWVDPTQISNNTTQFNIPYYGLNIGDVVYYGYKGNHNNRFDSYLQRLNPDGTIPWGINGMDFDVAQNYFEMDTRIAHKTGSQYIWAICNYTTPSQSQEGEYVQKFDMDTGARLFTENAKEVYPVDSNYNVHTGALQFLDGFPTFLLKSGFDNGATPVQLGVVKLDDNGNFAWPEESRPMATYAASKSRIHFTGTVVNEQAVAVFIEDKGVGPRIYAQNFYDGVLDVGDQVLSALDITFNNPVNDLLELQCNYGIQSLQIENVLGQTILKTEYTSVNELIIDTQHWSSGIYFMAITSEKGIVNGLKVIKR